MLGILYSEAGLPEQGEHELGQLPKGDPDYDLAQKLLKSIQKIRNPTPEKRPSRSSVQCGNSLDLLRITHDNEPGPIEWMRILLTMEQLHFRMLHCSRGSKCRIDSALFGLQRSMKR